MGSKLEQVTEKALFSSRWILAPIFLGLSLALMALGIKFFQEAYHLIAEVLIKEESDIVLKVLSLIDISLVGSLIVMVMFSGYENFVSTIDAKGTDSLGWLGKMDSGTLKLKVAASIVAISSIHLLRVFMQVGKKGEEGAHKRPDHVVRDSSYDLRVFRRAARRTRQDVVLQAPRALVRGCASRRKTPAKRRRPFS